MTKFKNNGARLRLLPVFLLAALVGACQEDIPDPVAVAEAALSAKPRPAKIFTVSDQVGLLSRRFTGRVEAVQTVDLSFQVAGKLIEMPVRESQEISKGELVAKLDPTDYERAVREAKLQLQQAKLDLGRLETLRARSVISEKSYDDQKNAYDLAIEALAAAEQNLEYTQIHAPFDGIVTRRLIDSFTTVNVGTAVVRVQDVSEVQIDINVPESMFAKVSEDLIASLNVEFPSLPGKMFPVTYREHSTEVDPVTQTYRVTLAMPRDPEVRIYPGMTAAVVVQVKPEGFDLENSFLVPVGAVAVDGSRNAYVWRFDDASGAVTKTPVQVGVVTGDYLPVTQGISKGDQIISAGVAYLSEGQIVRPLR
ncbi:efflux RND transporter periplasmic adaptor subunit [Roseibium algae]|uniref:Efflux RND transporter periplasmic adaptor subunit n=1 Tax=Roseibium algae TaxID=3123038 RepID=A0ABU8TM63_9HYPH